MLIAAGAALVERDLELRPADLKSMKISLKNVVLSAFFGALGPFFNKQATLDSSRTVYRFFHQQAVGWMIYPFDAVCILLMLWANTVSVKYKMLSYKFDGAFIGTTLIFVLGYIFSSGFDYIYDQQLLPTKRLLGALLVIAGVILISRQEQDANIKKQTASILVLVEGAEDGQLSPMQEHSSPEDCLIHNRRAEQPADARAKPGRGCARSALRPAAGDNEAPRPSRLRPNEMAAVDFIHLRKGYL
jgi:hypothetical protein